MRPSRPQLTVRWTILLAWVVAIDAAATNWTLAATKRLPVIMPSSGGDRRTDYRGFDGSRVISYSEGMTGKTTILRKLPPTATGLCYVWWPAAAGGFITLAILGLAATRNGRRLIGEFPPPRMTTRRLMIAVAVIAIEAVLIINVAKSNRVNWDFLNYRRPSRWPLLLIGLVAPPTLVLLQAFGRTRSAGAEKNSSEHNQ